jgi:site-specific recombinase XerD
MLRKTISVKFYTRKARVTEGGVAPVVMRIFMGREKFETATKIFVKPDEWRHEKVKGTNEEARRVNKCIEGFKLKAFDLQRELMNEGKEITLDNIKAKWFGISLERPRMLMEVFTQHNKQMKELVNKEFSPLTLERYETSFRHTQSFLRWKYKVDDIDIKNLNYELIADYEFWLKTERNCDHNTTVKYLSNFKKIVHICIKNGWLTRDPFVGFKMTKREVERPFLVEEELNRIINKTFLAPRIGQVRDIFVFCCYTGLAYADVEKLTRQEVTTGIDGEKWIWTSRQKTDTTTRVPLLPPALEILERYKDHPQCLNQGRLLPVLSNQKMNTYLKEIADACEITKKMTFHTARHTFATTVTLTNGVPIETVSKMLGHRNLKTTQHYAKILDRKVSEDMKVLRAKFSQSSRTEGSEPNDHALDLSPKSPKFGKP